MKRLLVVILSVFTLTAIFAYCDVYVYHHAHSIKHYCPYGNSHVVTCTPPGFRLAEHNGHYSMIYHPHFPPPDPWDEQICDGYLASDSEVCAQHENNQ